MNAAAPNSLRVPPHSLEAEQAVLGGIMLQPEAWDRVADVLQPEDFYRRDHRLIFTAIGKLVERNQPCDAITLGEWLKSQQQAGDVGGVGYLAELVNNTPSAANVRAHAEIVREKSMLRRLIDAGVSIAEDAYRPEGRATRELVDLAEQRVFAIAEGGKRAAGPRGQDDLTREALRLLQERYANRAQLPGLATGFNDLDTLSGGLRSGDLVIVAARPAMGKTAFALNIAEHAALRGKQTVLVFSMEMSASSVEARLVSSAAHVDASALDRGALLDDDWTRAIAALTLLSGARLFVDDSPALSLMELRARARRLQREHGLGLIVIDYLQLMQVPGSTENRATEISEISRGLKALAKELNVPVVALSQLNRSLEQRTDKRPVMADLRESGAIEQDADVIMFIYRDEYYHKDSSDKGLAEVIIGKQRNGPTEAVTLRWSPTMVRFDNMEDGV